MPHLAIGNSPPASLAISLALNQAYFEPVVGPVVDCGRVTSEQAVHEVTRWGSQIICRSGNVAWGEMIGAAAPLVSVGDCTPWRGSLLTRIATRKLNVPNAIRRYRVLCDFMGSPTFHRIRGDAHVTVAIEGDVWALRTALFCPQVCQRMARVATKNAQIHAQKHARKRGVRGELEGTCAIMTSRYYPEG